MSTYRRGDGFDGGNLTGRERRTSVLYVGKYVPTDVEPYVGKRR